jgi:dimethylaniline monooxygenase (N-oxide forming)
MRMAGYVPCGKVAVKGAAGPGSGAREVSGEVVGPDRTCVIGAGPSGLAAVKALAEAGLDFDCFEKSDRVGGNWVFGNRNGQSRIYRSLHINTSRQRMAYADFPMPADYPDFPHHALMARYFEAYAAAFGLHRRITFGTAVMRAEREEPGRWQLTLADGTIRCYRALVVANGHHWDPRWPEPPVPGPFAGEIIHAHDYVAPDEPIDFAGKRVVVVGMGNSAMDIACELSRPGIAERLYLSARRGAWVIPNYVLGRPMDRLGVGAAWLPWRVQSLMAELLIRLVVGAPWRFGLPRPDHPPLAAHPTVSQDLPVRLGRGDVVPKPEIRELQGRSVLFADGSTVEADVLIYCTGYQVSFPFFPPEFLAAPGNELPLWRRLLQPGEEDLFFVGLLQPLGAVMPIAEAQAKLIAALLAGHYRLPSTQRMRQELEHDDAARQHRYVASARHTMQVDFDRYLADLARERRAGERRAKLRLRPGAAAPS